MARKNAIRLYLTGTIGQITVIAIIVFLLRKIGIVVDYTTVIGMIAIGIGGISSAMWGSIVTIRYRKINFKRIVIEFVNIKQPGSMSILWAQKVELFSQHNICRENYFLGC